MRNTSYKSVLTNPPLSSDLGHTFFDEAKSFEHEWQSGKENFTMSTSGSMGMPTEMKIKRSQMALSAQMTLDFLEIRNLRALLCLNPSFIAGKMMIVRAIEGDMELVAMPPDRNPLQYLPQDISIDFAAFVPLQIRAILEDAPSTAILNNMDTVIIGGAPVSAQLHESLQKLKPKIYETFGMTETVSHFALKRISSEAQPFRVLPEVEIGQDQRGCLTVKSELTNHNLLVTNDVVKLVNNREFYWIGRADNVINSGGIKVQPEVVEAKVEAQLKKIQFSGRFIVSGVKDDDLGEKVVLLIESAPFASEVELSLMQSLRSLDKYQRPKAIHYLLNFIETPTGKVHRKETTSLLSS